MEVNGKKKSFETKGIISNALPAGLNEKRTAETFGGSLGFGLNVLLLQIQLLFFRKENADCHDGGKQNEIPGDLYSVR